MPGTGLYDRLEENGELLRPQWWIDPDFRYGDPIFEPKGMSARELTEGPMQARALFYDWRSILSRAWRGGRHWRHPRSIGLMLLANWISRREIIRKQARALAADQSIGIDQRRISREQAA